MSCLECIVDNHHEHDFLILNYMGSGQNRDQNSPGAEQSDGIVYFFLAMHFSVFPCFLHLNQVLYSFSCTIIN